MFKKLGALLVVFILLLIIAPAGFPVRITYVYSDSMSPTIETNEGFIIVQSEEIQSGDIITFRAAQREEFVTHRVVDRRDSGYVTRGDNNPTTDQAAGAPPVPEQAIIGKVLTIRGNPLTIPGYGIAVVTARNHQWIVLGILVGLLVRQLSKGDQVHRSGQSLTRIQNILAPIFLVSLLAGAGLLLFGAPTHELVFVGVAGQSAAPQAITVGEPHETSVVLNKSSLPATHRFITVDGASVVNTTRNQSRIALRLRIPPPSTTGIHSITIKMYQYPSVLPRTVVGGLHRVHPGLSAGLSMLVFISPLATLSLLLVDRKTPVRVPERRIFRRSNSENQ